MKHRTKNQIKFATLALLVIILAFLSTFNYIRNYFSYCAECEIIVNQNLDLIVRGDHGAPFAYRILTPWIMAQLGGDLIGVIIFHIIGRIALFSLTILWISRWSGHKLIGLFILFVALQASYPTWGFSDYSITEYIFIVTGWILITTTNGNPHFVYLVIYAILIPLATLNRESTGFILICSFLAVWGRQLPKWAIFYGLLGFAAFISLRYFIDATPSVYTISYVWSRNMQGWRLKEAIYYGSIFAILIGIVLLYGRKLPSLYTRFWVGILPYFLLVLVLGIWHEIRLFIPFVLLTLPILKDEDKISLS